MRLLDLFCGAGGAAMGYHRAGFDEIVGVDIKPMLRYPFAFVQADAFEYLREHGQEFDAIHASPPCQGYSNGTNYNHKQYGKKEYPLLIGPTRQMLQEIGRPFCIENVMGAKAMLGFTLTLCGTQFGLRVQRHRLFESSHLIMRPTEPCHHRPFDISVRRKRCEYLLAYRDVVTKRGVAVRRPPFCSSCIAAKAMECE